MTPERWQRIDQLYDEALNHKTDERLAAALNYTNICHLYDVGPNYLVIEYVEGEDLKGPLDFGDALPLIQHSKPLRSPAQRQQQRSVVRRCYCVEQGSSSLAVLGFLQDCR